MNIYETVTIEKELIVAQDMEIGIGKVNQKRPSGQRELDKVNVTTFGGALVVSTYADLEKLDANQLQTKAAIVLETGQVYSFNGVKWVTASAIAYSVNLISDLASVPTKVGVAVVREQIRGGVFVYDEALKDVNDGGIVIQGWKRQYDSIPNVKWFGATGDGNTDDTEAIKKAVEASTGVYFPAGNYKITSTIQMREKTFFTGVVGSKILIEGNITGVKLATYSAINNIEFTGHKDQTQLGVLVDGGASENDVLKTKLMGCNFREIGGPAYKIINSASVGHSVVGCSITNCKVGVATDQQGEGLELVNTGIDNCDEAVQLLGAGVKITNCSIVKNKIGLSFGAGVTGESMTYISNCVIEDCTQSFSAVDSLVKNVFIVDCSISDTIAFNNAGGFNFRSCDLTGAMIQFDGSNDNVFKDCILTNSNIVNDLSGTQTINYFVDCIDGSETFDGGEVEVARTTDFTIPSNGANAVVFDSILANKVAKHANLTKYKLYDEATGLFNLTQFVTPGKTKVHADIKVCVDSNDAGTLQQMAFYLYRVQDNSEVINSDIDLHKIEAVLTPTMAALPSGYGMFSFSGYIKRGNYKLVVYSRVGSRKLLANGKTFNSGAGTVACTAKFSEI